MFSSASMQGLAAVVTLACAACSPRPPESPAETDARWARVVAAAAMPARCAESTDALDAALAAAAPSLAALGTLRGERAESGQRLAMGDLDPAMVAAIDQLIAWSATGGYWVPDLASDGASVQRSMERRTELLGLGRAIAALDGAPEQAPAALAALVDRGVRCGLLIDAVIVMQIADDMLSSGRSDHTAALAAIGLEPADFSRVFARDLFETLRALAAANDQAIAEGVDDLPPAVVRRETALLSWWTSLEAEQLAGAQTFAEQRVAVDRTDEEHPESAFIDTLGPDSTTFIDRFEQVLIRFPQ
jgi:hypothetical protein